MSLHPYVKLHHYYTNPTSGNDTYDQDGEIMLGWYWQVFNESDKAISDLTGPYSDLYAVSEAYKIELRRGTINFN